MGTDTMAYCATALSFMLENLGKCYQAYYRQVLPVTSYSHSPFLRIGKPVVFTGSQIPCTSRSMLRDN